MTTNVKYIPKPYSKEILKKIQALKWLQHFQKTAFSGNATIDAWNWGSR